MPAFPPQREQREGGRGLKPLRERKNRAYKDPLSSFPERLTFFWEAKVPPSYRLMENFKFRRELFQEYFFMFVSISRMHAVAPHLKGYNPIFLYSYFWGIPQKKV